MTGNSARKRELREEPPDPGLIGADVGIDLAVGPFEVRVSDHRWPAVTGADTVDVRGAAIGATTHVHSAHHSLCSVASGLAVLLQFQ
jgi:hypothetical protein